MRAHTIHKELHHVWFESSCFVLFFILFLFVLLVGWCLIYRFGMIIFHINKFDVLDRLVWPTWCQTVIFYFSSFLIGWLSQPIKSYRGSFLTFWLATPISGKGKLGNNRKLREMYNKKGILQMVYGHCPNVMKSASWWET